LNNAHAVEVVLCGDCEFASRSKIKSLYYLCKLHLMIFEISLAILDISLANFFSIKDFLVALCQFEGMLSSRLPAMDA
jgi:hypothetical protein